MNTPLKVITAILAVAIVIVVLFTLVFPWFETNFVTDPTLTGHLPTIA